MITVYFDGSDRHYNAEGGGAYGVVIVKNGKTVKEISGPVVAEGPTSHNVAEYAGLIVAMKWLIAMRIHDQNIHVMGDSQLVINQMFHGWKIRGGLYAEKAREAMILRFLFPHMTGEWIPRDENRRADFLARREWENREKKK
jgi:probable phosphoglycerate mutase